MSTYAIIKTGGKQVKVEVGQAIYVEKINAEAGSEVTFNEVVLVGGDKTVVGTPVVEGATVVGTIEKQVNKRKLLLSNTNLKRCHVNRSPSTLYKSCYQRYQRVS